MADIFDPNHNTDGSDNSSVEDMAQEARRRAELYNKRSEEKLNQSVNEESTSYMEEAADDAGFSGEASPTITDEASKTFYNDEFAKDESENSTSGIDSASTQDDEYLARHYNETRHDSSSYSQYSFNENANRPHTSRKKKNDGKKKVIAIVLIVAVAGAALGATVRIAASIGKQAASLNSEITGDNGNSQPGTPGISDIPDTSDSDNEDSESSKSESSSKSSSVSGEMTVQQIVETCMPAMVSITTETVSEVQSYFGGESQSYTSSSAGSGVILEQQDDSILIITNEHVVSGSTTITATFYDDTTVSAEVAGSDSAEDLALIKVSLSDLSEDTLNGIRLMDVGDTSECQVGESVVAIGNALGYGQSVSSGIVSALNRQVTVDGVSHTLVQTDAAINPGNSGGALINMQGQLIGINEVKYNSTSVEGMGYAIPTNTIQSFVNTILNRTERSEVDESERGYLGISCMTVPDSYVEQGYPSGAYISEVTEGGPADQAGIQVGDIISSINGYSVSTADDLVEGVACIKSGETATLTVLRLNDDQSAYEAQTIEVQLTARSESALAQSDDSSSESSESDSQKNQRDNGISDRFGNLPYSRK